MALLFKWRCLLNGTTFQMVLTIFPTDSWHQAHAIQYLHALIQKDPCICNYNVMYTLVHWYLTESHHKCNRMCLWRDVDMQRIIDEPENVVTDYLRRCNRLLLFYFTLNSCGELLASDHVLHRIQKGMVKLQNIRQEKCFGWRRICEILMLIKCCTSLQYCKQSWILGLILGNSAMARYSWLYDTLCL